MLDFLYKGKTSWIVLQRIKESFLSKMITGISISVFALSSLDKLHLAQYFNVMNLKLTFVGGLLFVVGYAISAFFVPDEFRDVSSVNAAVLKYKNIEYEQFYLSRVGMLDAMFTRLKPKLPFDADDSALFLANKALNDHKARSSGDWKNYSSAIYLADVNLRQYDKPFVRWLSFILFIIGGGISVISTIIGASKILVGLL